MLSGATLKCIREVTEGSGRVRLGRPCRIFVSEMLLGSPADELGATSKCEEEAFAVVDAVAVPCPSIVSLLDCSNVVELQFFSESPTW